MKGPFERLKYDLRRLWECPQCKRRERSSGSVTAKFCTCGAGESGLVRHGMRMIEEAGHRTTPPIVLVHPPLEPPTLVVAIESLEIETPPEVLSSPEPITSGMEVAEKLPEDEPTVDSPVTGALPTDNTLDTGSA